MSMSELTIQGGFLTHIGFIAGVGEELTSMLIQEAWSYYSRSARRDINIELQFLRYT